MPELEFSSTLKYVAAAAALIAAYFADGSWATSLLKKLNPLVKHPVGYDASKVDEAVRTLLEDSQQRKCRKSVEFINGWVQTRNLSSVPETEVKQ